MIIGVLGKGGVGKSTVSTLFVKEFSKRGLVLAIDADHNMDLTYNLGNPHMKYIGDSINDLKSRIGLTQSDTYHSIFNQATIKHEFTLHPKDSYTNEYTTEVDVRTLLMSAGPQTDAVLYDDMCSHGLFTPLKVYLPLLKLNKNEFVVVDEKAGADGVTTGVVSGFDLALVVTEATLHSIKVAKQIAGYLDFYKTPYEIILNKYSPDDPKNHLIEDLPQKPIIKIPFTRDPFQEYKLDEKDIELLVNKYSQNFSHTQGPSIQNPSTQSPSRIDRTKEKIKNNKQYQINKHV